MGVGEDGAAEDSREGDGWGMRRRGGVAVEMIGSGFSGAPDPRDCGGVGVRRTPSWAAARWEQMYDRPRRWPLTVQPKAVGRTCYGENDDQDATMR